DISGLSRSVSNLGSSFGTALVGSALVATKLPAGKPFAIALTMMLVLTLIGLVLGVLIPRPPIEATAAADSAGHDGLAGTTEAGPPGRSTPRAMRARRRLQRWARARLRGGRQRP